MTQHKCCYTQCRILFVDMLNVIMLNVVMLNVVGPTAIRGSIIAPLLDCID
jgi:hypothetical protein